MHDIMLKIIRATIASILKSIIVSDQVSHVNKTRAKSESGLKVLTDYSGRRKTELYSRKKCFN